MQCSAGSHSSPGRPRLQPRQLNQARADRLSRPQPGRGCAAPAGVHPGRIRPDGMHRLPGRSPGKITWRAGPGRAGGSLAGLALVWLVISQTIQSAPTSRHTPHPATQSCAGLADYNGVAGWGGGPRQDPGRGGAGWAAYGPRRRRACRQCFKYSCCFLHGRRIQKRHGTKEQMVSWTYSGSTIAGPTPSAGGWRRG